MKTFRKDPAFSEAKFKQLDKEKKSFDRILNKVSTGNKLLILIGIIGIIMGRTYLGSNSNMDTKTQHLQSLLGEKTEELRWFTTYVKNANETMDTITKAKRGGEIGTTALRTTLVNMDKKTNESEDAGIELIKVIKRGEISESELDSIIRDVEDDLREVKANNKETFEMAERTLNHKQ